MAEDCERRRRVRLASYFRLLPCIVRICTIRTLRLVGYQYINSSQSIANLQDVKHIKLETNCFLHRITRDDTALGKASMMKDFLRAAKISQSIRPTQWDKNILVENEATENGKATIQRNRFSDGQGARTERKGHWRQ